MLKFLAKAGKKTAKDTYLIKDCSVKITQVFPKVKLYFSTVKPTKVKSDLTKIESKVDFTKKIHMHIVRHLEKTVFASWNFDRSEPGVFTDGLFEATMSRKKEILRIKLEPLMSKNPSASDGRATQKKIYAEIIKFMNKEGKKSGKYYEILDCIVEVAQKYPVIEVTVLQN